MKISISIIIGLILLAGIAYVIWPKGSNQVVCTMEAKLCLDGSSVGRTGPNCEFSPCPGEKTAVDSGISFQYLEILPFKYISIVDWPPKVQVLNESFSCNEAGLEISQGGQTEKVQLGSNVYCVTKSSGGAAGSTYTQYAYAFPKDNKTIILTFTLRFPQCANYDDPQKTACQTERDAFDIDSMVDKMAQTVR